MATPNPQQTQHSQSAGQNARRYGIMGLVAGALFGLFTGGVPGMLKMALIGGGASAVGGAVIGNKINPLMDRLLDMLPGRRAPETPQMEQQPNIAQGPQVSRGAEPPAINGPAPSQPLPGYSPPDQQTHDRLRAATAGLDRGVTAGSSAGEIGHLPPPSQPKTPTHQAPPGRQ